MENSGGDSMTQNKLQQKKGFKLDTSWKENKEALIAIIKWAVLLIVIKTGLVIFQ